MSTNERNKPIHSPIYLQVLRPERVGNSDINKEKMKDLEQLMHDKTDDLKVLLTKQDSTINKLIEDNADLRKILLQSKQNIDTSTPSTSAKLNNDKDIEVLRMIMEGQAQKTAELMIMMTKLLESERERERKRESDKKIEKDDEKDDDESPLVPPVTRQLWMKRSPSMNFTGMTEN